MSQQPPKEQATSLKLSETKDAKAILAEQKLTQDSPPNFLAPLSVDDENFVPSPSYSPFGDVPIHLEYLDDYDIQELLMEIPKNFRGLSLELKSMNPSQVISQSHTEETEAVVEYKSSSIPEEALFKMLGQKSEPELDLIHTELVELITQADRELRALVTMVNHKPSIDSEKLITYLRTTHETLYQLLSSVQRLSKKTSQDDEFSQNLARANALCMRAYYFAYQTFNKDEGYLILARAHGKGVNFNAAALCAMDNYIIARVVSKTIEELAECEKEEFPVLVKEIWAKHLHAAMSVCATLVDQQSTLDQFFSDLSKKNSHNVEKENKLSPVDEKIRVFLDRIRAVQKQIKYTEVKKMLQSAFEMLDDGASYYDVPHLIHVSSDLMYSAAKLLGKQLNKIKESKGVGAAEILRVVDELNDISAHIKLIKKPEASEEKQAKTKDHVKVIVEFHQNVQSVMDGIEHDIGEIQRIDFQSRFPQILSSQYENKISQLRKLDDEIFQLKKSIRNTCFNASPTGFLLKDDKESSDSIKETEKAIEQFTQLKDRVAKYHEIVSSFSFNPEFLVRKTQISLMGHLDDLHQKIRKQIYTLGRFSAGLDSMPKEVAGVSPEARRQETRALHMQRVGQLVNVWESVEVQWQMLMEAFEKARQSSAEFSSHGLCLKLKEKFFDLDGQLLSISPDTSEGCEKAFMLIAQIKVMLASDVNARIVEKLGSTIKVCWHSLITAFDNFERRMTTVQNLWKEFSPKLMPEQCKKITGELLKEYGEAKKQPHQFMREKIINPHIAHNVLTGLTSIANETLGQLLIDAKNDLSKVNLEAFLTHLKTTHELLYQCLVVSEEFQIKQGKATHAINIKLIERAHVVLARGYNMASKILKNDQFCQYEKEYWKNLPPANLYDSASLNYKAATKILDDAKKSNRELNSKEKEEVHIYLNALLRPGSDFEFMVLAKAELNELLRVDSVEYEPIQQEIIKLYGNSPGKEKSSNTSVSSEEKFYQHNKNLIAEIHSDIRNIYQVSIPIRKGSLKVMDYVGKSKEILEYASKMTEAFFMHSPVEFLLPREGARVTVATAANELKALCAKIVGFVDYLEGAPELLLWDEQREFIRRLKDLNKKIQKCAFDWEIYSAKFFKPDEKEILPSIQQVLPVMESCRKIGNICQAIKAKKRGDKEQAFFMTQIENLLQELLPMESAQASQDIKRRVAAIQKFITENDSLLNTFCGHLKNLKEVLEKLDGQIAPQKKVEEKRTFESPRVVSQGAGSLNAGVSSSTSNSLSVSKWFGDLFGAGKKTPSKQQATEEYLPGFALEEDEVGFMAVEKS